LFDNGFERGLNVNKFKNLKKLEHLYFGDFEVTNPEKLHSFDGFSDAFCEFRNLKSLNIKHSNIRRIPDCIKNLKKLVEILLLMIRFTESHQLFPNFPTSKQFIYIIIKLKKFQDI